MAEEATDWFVREILPHEAALTRYIARAWPNASDVQDIRHDAYIRVYEAAVKSPPTSPKSFLFATTRHVMADRARRNRIVSIDLLEDIESLEIMVDDISPERRTSGRQQLQRLSNAFNRIPTRCREVVWLQRVEGLAHKEIAARLGMALATVEKHAMSGIRLLAAHFHGEVPAANASRDGSSGNEAHHGK
jgi:RNA polymerase sigma factor (sigma-70 family)